MAQETCARKYLPLASHSSKSIGFPWRVVDIIIHEDATSVQSNTRGMDGQDGGVAVGLQSEDPVQPVSFGSIRILNLKF